MSASSTTAVTHDLLMYVVRQRGKRRELLVHEVVSHSGQFDIPREVVAVDESAGEAIARGLRDRAGLDRFGTVRMLRADRWRTDDSSPWRIRHFFVVEVDEERQRWQHISLASEQHGAVLDYFWTPITPPLREALGGGAGDYIDSI
ncbi:MAG: hypothetical protein AAGI01_15675 [Myxococcota bacterium]